MRLAEPRGSSGSVASLAYSRIRTPKKVSLYTTMKLCMGSRGVAPLIHILGTSGWCPELYRQFVTSHNLVDSVRDRVCGLLCSELTAGNLRSTF